MDRVTQAATNAADAIALDLINELDIDVSALAIVILTEVYRQRRRYYDRLNETATINPATQPEQECPV